MNMRIGPAAAILIAVIVLLQIERMPVRAQEPVAKPPVAVRWWGGDTVSIESFWQPPIVIDPSVDDASGAAGEIGVVIPTEGQVDAEIADQFRGRPFAVELFDAQGDPQRIHVIYDRLPNQPRHVLLPNDDVQSRTSHEVAIRNAPAMTAPESESGAGSTFPLQIVVDGVVIIHWGDLGATLPSSEVLQYVANADVLLLPVVGDVASNADLRNVVQSLNPRFVLPISDRRAAADQAQTSVDQFVASLATELEIVRAKGNTLAAGAVGSRGDAPTKVVLLQDKPWGPKTDLGGLLDRMEAACRASQEVFAPLSIEQMNFRPSNGTHTPRWNPEHMTGRQLGFFTEIFAAIDPAFAAVDLNPAQMPDDYQPAHANWTGQEEARNMARVSALVRRFAFLLDGVPLDEPAPGSRWTLRGLLKQMERHFNEHTANVKQKFELPDWPSE